LIARVGLLVALMLPLGCTVASLDDKAGKPAQNSCTPETQAADCGDGVCDPALHVCHAPEGQFASIVLQVTPPANHGVYGGVTFVLPEELSAKGGDRDLDLGSLSQVKGTVTPGATGYGDSSCVAGYGPGGTSTSAPVKVTFTSVTGILGLSAPQYSTKSEYDVSSDGYPFEISLPPDDYSVYVEPAEEAPVCTPSQPCPCPIVPVLTHQTVENSVNSDLPIVIQPNLLHVEVLWPAKNVSATQKTPLENWSIDVVDPASGRVLSAPAALTYLANPADPDSQHYMADVSYTELQDNPGKELIRLKPPEGVVAPTLVAERGQVEFLTAGQGLIDALQQMPDPATVELTFVDDSGALARDALAKDPNDPTQQQPIAATVRFVSVPDKLKLDATAGTQAFYETTVDVMDATLTVELVPGQYDVYVAPPVGSGFATTHAVLDVAKPTTPNAPPQAGKTITLETPSDVGGSVLTPGGSPAVGATAQAVAAPIPLTPLEVAVGAAPFKTQSSSSIIGPDGQFAFQADPGTVDFSVRTADGTSFAWLVRPKVDVQPGTHDLGEMTLPLPVVYQGKVTVPDKDNPPKEVPNALIRAYIFLNEGGYTADRAGAQSIVQIAETRAGEDGSYQLFLPSHLN
jgi:hypothetical protein